MTYYDSKAEIRKVWKKGFDLEDEAQFVGEFPRKAYKWDNLYGYTWPDRNNENENWFEIYDHNGTFVQKIDLYPAMMQVVAQMKVMLLYTGSRYKIMFHRT